MSREEVVLRRCASRFGIEIECRPDGFVARYRGLPFGVCLGVAAPEALARFQATLTGEVR